MQTNYSFKETPARLNRKQIGLYLIGSLLLVLVILAAGFFFSPVGQRWLANQTSAAPAVSVNQIEILADDALNHVFTPTVVQVEAGSTITWQFKEVDEEGQPVPHNVVFDDVASPVQATGTFSHTFAQPGSYRYVCTLHPFMEGMVIVTE